MQQAVHSPPLTSRFRFVWILDSRRDWLFYLGAALAGWLYLALIWYAIRTLEHPLTDPFGTLRLGGVTVPLSLQLLVVVSWGFIFDAPHVWATLGRTLFDPDEWRVRRREILFSFVWFAVGPLLILLPYLIGDLTALFGYYLPAGSFAVSAIGFFTFFRLWAYYHVVRQHWGFFNLYKRKANDQGHNRLDYWFFNLAFYLPMLLFLTGDFYTRTPGFPNLGLHTPLVAGLSLASMLYPVLLTAFMGILAAYAGHQVYLFRRGEPLNANKLLYLLLLIPLHFLAFGHPITVLFVVPLVTIGHNIQYHCIVYSYARNKYGRDTDGQYRWSRLLFKNFAVYALVGFAFTFALYRGPWVNWIRNTTGLKLDEVLFNSVGMMAGIQDPAALGLGQQVFAAFIVGFALQHYYLDSKIWRVSKDQQVRQNLKV
ncbi:MAG: hypothetical protein H7Z75_05105 [Ferruginibacter sp.]|nr:hypothetical protein [Cytophagales bacterium]